MFDTNYHHRHKQCYLATTGRGGVGYIRVTDAGSRCSSLGQLAHITPIKL